MTNKFNSNNNNNKLAVPVCNYYNNNYYIIIRNYTLGGARGMEDMCVRVPN